MDDYRPSSRYTWDMSMPRTVSPCRIVLNDRSGRYMDVYLNDDQTYEVFKHFVKNHTQYAYEEIMKITGINPYADDTKKEEKSSTTKKSKKDLKLLLL